MKKYDIAIIGGGFAGITAARELSQAGNDILVIEAKDHLGGRTYSNELNGINIEMGGGYVFWTQPHLWSELTRYGLSVEERPHYANVNNMMKARLLIDGELRDQFTPEENKQIAVAFQQFSQPATDILPNPYCPLKSDVGKQLDGLSNLDKINQMDLNALQRSILLRTFSMQCNNAPSEGGYTEALRWFALVNGNTNTYADSISRFTLKEGTSYLLNCIANDANADFVFNTQITKIHQTDNGVRIESSTDYFCADCCIVATPLNTWKNIEFTPTISAQKMAFSNEELSGKGHKIYIQLNGRFKDSRWSALNTAILTLLPHYVSDDFSIVVAFTNPEYPLQKIDLIHLQKEIDRWDDSYEVVDFKYHDWVEDTCALGTWGNFKPNQMSTYYADAITPEGNIYFAGSDIAKGWRGFIDGAIESGLTTANTIKSKIN